MVPVELSASSSTYEGTGCGTEATVTILGTPLYVQLSNNTGPGKAPGLALLRALPSRCTCHKGSLLKLQA